MYTHVYIKYILENIDSDWSFCITDGWWKLCRVFEKNFPDGENEAAVDPFVLLSLIYSCTLFSKKNNRLQNLISCVDFIRLCQNILYGRVPNLMITMDLLAILREKFRCDN